MTHGPSGRPPPDGFPETRGSRIGAEQERERARRRLRRMLRRREEKLVVSTEEKVPKEIQRNGLVKLHSKMTLQEMLTALGGRIADKESNIQLSKLVPVDCQPATRTDHIKDLKDDIASTGKLLHHGLGIAWGNHVILADGNRRRSAVGELGWKTMPVKLVEGVPTKAGMFVARRVWGIANRGSLKMKGSYWFAAWALIQRSDREAWLKDCVSQRIAANIRRMADVLGIDEAERIGRTEVVDPCVVNNAARLEKVLLSRRSDRKKTPDLATMLLWMVNTKSDVTGWLNTVPKDASCDRMVLAIRRGAKFPREKW